MRARPLKNPPLVRETVLWETTAKIILTCKISQVSELLGMAPTPPKLRVHPERQQQRHIRPAKRHAKPFHNSVAIKLLEAITTETNVPTIAKEMLSTRMMAISRARGRHLHFPSHSPFLQIHVKKTPMDGKKSNSRATT
eukprot:Skav214881  [mRNA]  locus=scaffold1430:168322:168738:+ [translate_table: standard]